MRKATKWCLYLECYWSVGVTWFAAISQSDAACTGHDGNTKGQWWYR